MFREARDLLLFQSASYTAPTQNADSGDLGLSVPAVVGPYQAEKARIFRNKPALPRQTAHKNTCEVCYCSLLSFGDDLFTRVRLENTGRNLYTLRSEYEV